MYPQLLVEIFPLMCTFYCQELTSWALSSERQGRETGEAAARLEIWDVTSNS